LVLLAGLLFLGRLCASCADESRGNQQIENSAPTEHDRSPMDMDDVWSSISNQIVPAPLKDNVSVATLLTRIPKRTQQHRPNMAHLDSCIGIMERAGSNREINLPSRRLLMQAQRAA